MSEGEKTSSSRPLTDEERLILCQKLDEELDEFIEGLEKRRYIEGWPEDRWEEEMNKHPFFMKNVPQNGELSPLAEGLAKLKYDPEENTPLELATNYKEDGNFNFKHKNYRLAILGYTEGIKVKCDDAEINSGLYNNRAAAHWQLKNYRSALFDSEKSLTFNPDHAKARLRAAKCALQIANYKCCIDHCNKLLQKNKDEDILELLNIAKRKKLIKERDQRKRNRMDAKNVEQNEAVIKAIIERGIKILNCRNGEGLDLAKLEPNLPGAVDARVHLDNGILKWPVLFLYPEYQLTDFIKACPENVPLLNQLEQVFPAPWDRDNKYSTSTVTLYFEGYDRLPHVADPTKNLGDILKNKYVELKAGTPAYVVVPRGSPVESRFLRTYL